jgi:hypothetical protein
LTDVCECPPLMVDRVYVIFLTIRISADDLCGLTIP